MHHQKNIFVVLGVARSGTSAIVRGLKALGIELGSNMGPAHQKWNAKGFFEDTDIVYNIHGEIFSRLEFAPYGIQTLSEARQTDACLDFIKKRAIELLHNRFLNTDYWGFKDPSTVKLLTFWQAIFREMHIQENYIIALRNPLAMAESYQHVTGSDIEIGLLLWLMHLVPAIENTHGKKRLVVSYERLLEHPDLQLERMRTTFALPELADIAAREIYTEDFLDKKLHRHMRLEEDLASHPAMGIAPLCARVWHLLMKVATDTLNFEHPVFQSEWQTILQELEKIKPVYDYMDRLLKNNHQLKKNLRDIHKSVIWKALYPLRFVDQTFRKRRQAARMKKRLSKAYG